MEHAWIEGIYLRLALRRWWANDGRLISCVRQEWAAFAARERAHHKQLLIHHQRDDVTGVGWLSEKFFLTAEQAALKLQAAARGMLCRMHTQLLLRLHHRSAVRIQSMWLGWQTRCRIVPQRRQELRLSQVGDSQDAGGQLPSDSQL